MVDADSRPTFLELENEFMNMTKDPGRYLVIQVNNISVKFCHHLISLQAHNCITKGITELPLCFEQESELTSRALTKNKLALQQM